jgi:hypothetical protein
MEGNEQFPKYSKNSLQRKELSVISIKYSHNLWHPHSLNESKSPMKHNHRLSHMNPYYHNFLPFATAKMRVFLVFLL